MKNNFGKKIVSGMFWKFGERISAQLVTLIVSIVLARILDPEHYGTISIILIFINIANVFVTESFSAALIQKKDADNVDFSTIFYFNIIFSLMLYGIIYITAPSIEKFYGNMPELADAMRLLALKIPISSINSVQQAYVSRKMMFKKFFLATIIGTVISAVVGIAMAYSGFGVYALVWQYLTNSVIDTVILWFAVKWRPVLAFSFQKFKQLFSYGWKILVTSLIRTIYDDIYSLVIGKKYTAEDLAFYSKGKQYPRLIITNVTSATTSVMFPALSKCQDDKGKLRLMMRRAIKTSSYILSPLMIGMAVVATPLVSIVLTDKWLPCVPFLQISCLALLLQPMQSANLQAIKAIGRSGLVLKLEIAKRIIGISILIISMQFGVLAIAWGSALNTLIASVLNAIPSKRLLGYNYFQQIWDIIPNFVLAGVMGTIVYPIRFLGMNNALTLIIQVLVGGIAWIILSVFTKNENYKYLITVLKGYKKDEF